MKVTKDELEKSCELRPRRKEALALLRKKVAYALKARNVSWLLVVPSVFHPNSVRVIAPSGGWRIGRTRTVSVRYALDAAGRRWLNDVARGVYRTATFKMHRRIP